MRASPRLCRFFMLGRFGRARGGMAAVEFAFLLPVMITMFFGVVEVSMALSCRADVTNVASTAADLTAQASSLSTNDVGNIFSAASAILYPYDASAARITITSLTYNTTSKSLTSGNVSWSCANTGAGRSKGDSVALPAGLMTEGGSVIMAEITYNYASPTTKLITGPMTMANTFYTKPRRVLQIAGPASCS